MMRRHASVSSALRRVLSIVVLGTAKTQLDLFEHLPCGLTERKSALTQKARKAKIPKAIEMTIWVVMSL